jgi:hypothetical protein
MRTRMEAALATVEGGRGGGRDEKGISGPAVDQPNSTVGIRRLPPIQLTGASAQQQATPSNPKNNNPRQKLQQPSNVKPTL